MHIQTGGAVLHGMSPPAVSSMKTTLFRKAAVDVSYWRPPHDADWREMRRGVGGYILALCLDDQVIRPLESQGDCASARRLLAGESLIWNLEERLPTVEAPHVLTLSFSQAALDAIAEDANAGTMSGLCRGTDEVLTDPVIMALGVSILPELKGDRPVSTLFARRMTETLLTHVAIKYGDLTPRERPCKGGLAPWQARRAEEMMTARLDRNVDIEKVARECGLSASHFSRAFRTTMGEPPHTWLVKRRLDAAKDLMARPQVPLADVALSCGFADQSHFTRAFTRRVGTSPGLWRRCLLQQRSAG